MLQLTLAQGSRAIILQQSRKDIIATLQELYAGHGARVSTESEDDIDNISPLVDVSHLSDTEITIISKLLQILIYSTSSLYTLNLILLNVSTQDEITPIVIETLETGNLYITGWNNRGDILHIVGDHRNIAFSTDTI